LENSDDARGCPLTFILSPEGRGKGEGEKKRTPRPFRTPLWKRGIRGKKQINQSPEQKKICR